MENDLNTTGPWWAVAGLAIGAAGKALADIVGGGRKARADQLDLALARLEKMERRVDGQAAEIDRLKTALNESERKRILTEDRCVDLQERVDSLETEQTTTNEHVATLTQQILDLGQQPAPKPVKPQPKRGAKRS